MVDIGGGLGGSIGGFWSGSSTSFISCILLLIQTPSIFSRNVLFILLELQPHFILGPSFSLRCWLGRGSRSWGIGGGGGGLTHSIVFSLSVSLNRFSTSGVTLEVFGGLGGVGGGGVLLEIRSLNFTSFFNPEHSPTLRWWSPLSQMGQGTLVHPQPAQRAGQNYLGSIVTFQIPVSWIGVGWGGGTGHPLAQLCHSHVGDH